MNTENLNSSMLLAIPIAIIANLLTPVILQRLDKIFASTRQRRKKLVLFEYERVTKYKNNISALYIFFISYDPKDNAYLCLCRIHFFNNHINTKCCR